MIDIQNVSTLFDTPDGPLAAVDDVSLHVPEGSIQGIIGFSGAGKSTLLRTMNLLERPSSGRVIVNGTDLLSLDVQQLRAARHGIGIVFQHVNLLNNLTVQKNVELLNRRRDRATDHQRDPVLRPVRGAEPQPALPQPRRTPLTGRPAPTRHASRTRSTTP